MLGDEIRRCEGGETSHNYKDRMYQTELEVLRQSVLPGAFFVHEQQNLIQGEEAEIIAWPDEGRKRPV